MYLMCVSLNHHQLPIEVREQFAFNGEEIVKADQILNSEKSILENLILSTCNRTEVYAVVDQIHTGRYYIKRFLAGWFHYTPDEFEDYITVFTKRDAVTHLLEVASGLDSKLKGEPQILGQIKNAYQVALETEVTGAIFNHLFKQAITFAKKMHTEYPVSELSQSSGQAGLHQIKLDLNDLHGKELAIVGSGHIGTHTAYNASTMGFSRIFVMNRTPEKAEALAANLGENVNAESIDQLPALMPKLDAVVFATSTKQPMMGIDSSFKPTNGHLDVIDLGVPRNIAYDGNAAVDYYDIDHLNNVVSVNNEKKQQMLAKIAQNIQGEADEYFVWERQLHIVPVIRGLRDHALQVEGEAYDSLLRKLPDLDAHERKVISKHMKSIINQMIKTPIKEIKELSVQNDANLDIDLFCQIFGLNNVNVEQQANEK